MGFLSRFPHRFLAACSSTAPHLFLASAIAGVTALLILLNALSDGSERDHESELPATLSTGHVNVGGFSK